MKQLVIIFTEGGKRKNNYTNDFIRSMTDKMKMRK